MRPTVRAFKRHFIWVLTRHVARYSARENLGSRIIMRSGLAHNYRSKLGLMAHLKAGDSPKICKNPPLEARGRSSEFKTTCKLPQFEFTCHTVHPPVLFPPLLLPSTPGIFHNHSFGQPPYHSPCGVGGPRCGGRRWVKFFFVIPNVGSI